MNWITSLRARAAAVSGIDPPGVAVDGKTDRRSHDRNNGLGPLHAVSAWASEYELSLGQMATEEKSNEITAIPELLRLIDVRGAIITLDAMGTQKAIAKQLIDGGADSVLALKGNPGHLHQQVVEESDRQIENDFAGAGARRHVTTETGQGREETRICIQMPAPKSLPMGVKRFARAVRGHWGIENSCHWSLEMTYRADESRIRDEHLRQNFAWLNRLTLSLLKQHPGKDSIAMKRRSCGWSDPFLTEILTGQTT
jgi:predicted transposase YbfD/YdcC